MDPVTILAALLPVLVEGGKAAVSRFIAPAVFKPSTIEQVLQLKTADLQFFQAINAAGGSNPTYLWVEACVRLMRPVFCVGVLAAWGYAHISGFGETASVDNMAAAVGFYLLGDRTLFYSSRALARQ